MNNYLYILILVIIILSSSYYIYHNRGVVRVNLQWIDKGEFNPKERYNDVVDEFGEPKFLDPRSGGLAIWNKKLLESANHVLDRVELLDEYIEHNHPAPHVDFLYGYFKINIPENKICDVISLSDSITYDPLKKMLRARCHFMGAVYATLVLASRIAHDKITLSNARKEYGPMIFATAPNNSSYDPNAIQSYINELKEIRMK